MEDEILEKIALRIIMRLDRIARDVDPGDYGLPIFSDDHLVEMKTYVMQMLQDLEQ